MAYLFLGISSVSFAWLIWQVSVTLLDRFSNRLRSARFRNLMSPSVAGDPRIGRGSSRPFGNLALLLGRGARLSARSRYSQRYVGYLSAQLGRAGLSGSTPDHLLGHQLIGSFIGGLAIGVLSENFWMTILFALLGGLLPLLWVRDQALSRERRLLGELPNALESLSLCSEAGLSLEQAMDQYVKSARPGPLREEFMGMLEQTRSGSARKEALQATADKLCLTDFNLFASSVIQAEKFGMGVSKTLRQLSFTLRDKRSQRAEKAVQELPVKLLLPLILCIMPVTFLVIFGPILLQFLKP